MAFSEMALAPEIVQALTEMGVIDPTDIQQQSIPSIINSNDTHILGQAKTGTGKTLAFAIPIIQMINPKKKRVQAVVLVPTRELCKQVSDVFFKLSKYKEISTCEVYGGVSINIQMSKIQNGAQVVIATPGRLIDIYKRGRIDFKYVRFVTLDEADRMLDMGFFPDVEYLLLKGMKNAYPRLMLYSATLAKEIKNLAKEFTKGKELIEIFVSEDDKTVVECDQSYYLAKKYEFKYPIFIEIVNQIMESSQKDKYTFIVFVRTKRWADKLSEKLQKENQLTKKRKLKIDVLHGDISQNKREIVAKSFKDQKINCLIATDVASRGLDFQVSHVINYDFPDGGDAIDNYIHRIGRTARVSAFSGKTRQGNAISIVTKNQMRTLNSVEHHIQKQILKVEPPELKDLSNYNCPSMTKGNSGNRRDRRNSKSRDNTSTRRTSENTSKSRSGNRSGNKSRSNNKNRSGNRSGNKSRSDNRSNENKSQNEHNINTENNTTNSPNINITGDVSSIDNRIRKDKRIRTGNKTNGDKGRNNKGTNSNNRSRNRNRSRNNNNREVKEHRSPEEKQYSPDQKTKSRRGNRGGNKKKDNKPKNASIVIPIK